ncbi:MAG: hypothetical protein ACYC1D_16310 [Acidimicrobiales bacterium]
MPREPELAYRLQVARPAALRNTAVTCTDAGDQRPYTWVRLPGLNGQESDGSGLDGARHHLASGGLVGSEY